MTIKFSNSIIPEVTISSKIYSFRGKTVMLDEDLALLYGVETRRLNEQVKRNSERFPDDFMFQLTQDEFNSLTSQIAISKRGGRRKLPYAFTEQGIAMLSGVLNSERAIKVNIRIMRVFSRMHELLENHREILKKLEELERKGVEHDEKILLIFEYLKQLESVKQQEIDQRSRKIIGFNR